MVTNTLTPEEMAIFHKEYEEYLKAHERTRYYKGTLDYWPLSFDDWWRTMADNAKEQRPGK
jgi:hypothetical protein